MKKYVYVVQLITEEGLPYSTMVSINEDNTIDLVYNFFKEGKLLWSHYDEIQDPNHVIKSKNEFSTIIKSMVENESIQVWNETSNRMYQSIITITKTQLLD